MPRTDAVRLGNGMVYHKINRDYAERLQKGYEGAKAHLMLEVMLLLQARSEQLLAREEEIEAELAKVEETNGKWGSW